MPSIYDLKPAFQARLRPMADRLARAGITPNQVTLAGIGLSITAGLAIALFPAHVWPLWLVPVALFLRMALNAIDGMLAREHDMQTALGAMLNELGDVVSDAALYLPFAGLAVLSAPLVVSVVVVGIFTEMTGVVAQTLGASRRYDGPMGKSDRAALFGTIAVWVALFGGPALLLDGILMLAAVLLTLTVIQRARRALAEVAA